MENNRENLSELDALKADYALLKQSFETQKTASAKLLAEIKQRRVNRLNQEVSRRIWGNLLALPLALTLLLCTDWPPLVAAFVAVWGLVNVGYALRLKRRMQADRLLAEDVKSATRTLLHYRRFYQKALIVNSLVTLSLMFYLFMGIVSKMADGASAQHIGALGVAFALAAIAIEVRHYLRHHKLCNELQEQFNE